MRGLSRKIDSNYVRAWCQEWAMGADAMECALEYYARVDDPIAVGAFLAGLASAQRSRYKRARILKTPKQFFKNPSCVCFDMDLVLKAMEDDLVNRFF